MLKEEEKQAKMKWKKENKTIKQWEKLGRKPRKNARKIFKEYDYFFNGKNYPQHHTYFNIKSTIPLTKKDKEKIRREKEEKKRQEGRWKTSWQWLSEEHRKVKDNAIPKPKNNWIFDPAEGEFYQADKAFYYYSEYDIEEVSEEEFNCLKDLYIKKFGGWEKIDLKNTKYNGKKWY